MYRLKMDLAGLVKHQKMLADEFVPAALRGIRRGAKRAVVILQRATQTAPPASPNGATGAVNTGAFRGGWRDAALPDGVRVYNLMPYGGVIEAGRRAGSRMPPKDAIVAWARRRLRLSLKEAKQAAFPIMRAIAERGLAARRIVANAIPQITDIIDRAMMRELNVTVRKKP